MYKVFIKNISWVFWVLLGLQPLMAQVSSYSFTQSTSSYTAITGGTVLGTTTTDDQRFVNPATPAGGTVSAGPGFPIGFNFTYNGFVYDVFGVNANGWVSFGQSALGAAAVDVPASYTAISSTSTATAALQNRVAVLSRDLQAQTGAAIRFQTIGTAPNRVCVIQWSGYRRYAQTGDLINMQLRLYETTNAVQIVYGLCSTSSATSSTGTQVGLRGSTNADFNNRTTTNNWAATTSGATNADGCTFASGITPSNGLTFTWRTPVANDASIPSLVTTSLCPGNQSLVVTLQNQGNNNLTSATVQWSVNGVAQTPINVTGINLAPGASTTVTLGSYNYLAAVSYNILVNSSMPNGVVDNNTSNDLLTLSNMTTGFSGTYTINGAVATGGTNFQTFAAAIAALGSGICGNVIFNVAQGTYNEQMLIGNIAGTTPSSSVTFRADPANTAPAILTFAATGTANNYLIRFNGAQYINIDGLTINSTGTTYTRAIEFMGMNESIQVLNNTISIPTATSTSTNNAAIYHNTGTSNVANYVTLDGNTVTGGSYGLYLYGMTSTSHEVGNRVTNNSFSNYYYAGIFCYYQDSAVIDNNNIVSNQGVYTTQYGLYYYYSDYGSVSANRIVTGGTSTNYGLYSYYSDGSAATPNRFANNMISCLGGTGTTYAMYLYNNIYANVYHNSINVTGGSATAGYAMYLNSTSTIYNNINVLNNIGVNTGGGYALYLSTSATSGAITNLNNNDWFGTGPLLVSLAGSGQADLATYKTAVAPLDANAISADPSFAADDDLHVCNGLLNGTGALGTGISVDIDGDVRCPGGGCPGGLSLPDIGADEFVEPAGDVKPHALLYPEDNKCGQVSQNVIVSLVNTRCSFIDSVAVIVNVTGPLPTTIGGMLKPISLPGDDTASFFVGAIPTTTAGLYTFQIITQLPGDVDPTNDTLVVSINVTAALILSPSITNANCQQNDGAIAVSNTGGVAPFTYQWDNTQITSSISGLIPGAYVVTVSDAVGCEASITATVAANSATITGAATTTNANCSNPDGSATISASGGTGNYSYLWSNGAFGATANNLSGGTYNVTITDSNGCMAVSAATININTSGNLNLSTSSTNSGCMVATGTATANVTGGSGTYTFIWSNAATGATVSGLAPGTYSVTANDAGGCSTVASVTVNSNTDLNGTAAVTNVACNGQANGAIDFTPSGGTAPYSYLWSNAAITQDINALTAGAYSVTVTDNGGCVAVVSGINVINPGVLSASAVVSSANGIGFNGSINVSVTGGTAPFSYIWSDGWIEQDHMNVQSGTYSLTITDANGCVTTQSFTVGNTTALNEAESTNWTINVYPNPAETMAKIDIQLSRITDVQISLVNITGQVLHSEIYPDVENVLHQIDLYDLPAGVYMLQILADKQLTTRKLVVKK